MAFAQQITKNGVPTVFYNVEQAVGLNAPNAQGDVKLVQYMLKGIYRSAAPNLAVDGYIGPITINWIKRFQGEMKGAGRNVLADGRVDRAMGFRSSVSKTTYTIDMLNFQLQQVNPAAWASLPASVQLSTNPRANPYNPQKTPAFDRERYERERERWMKEKEAQVQDDYWKSEAVEARKHDAWWADESRNVAAAQPSPWFKT